MENGYSGVERRRHKRVRVRLNVVFRKNEPLDVRIRTLEGETRAQMVDISESGMAIISNVAIPIATVLWIRFTLSKAEKESVSFYGTAEVLGKVVNSAPHGHDVFRLGILFLEVDDVSKREIANFVSVLEQTE
jgi:c-di-GMP-binding flagellar brake protein YcgR